MKRFSSTAFLFLICGFASAQRLEKFTAETPDPLVPNRKVIYETTRGYFDYILEKDSVAYQVLYLWVPDTITELGVRVISPVNELTSPNRGDIASAGYELNHKDDSTYFDPVVTVEYAPGIVSVKDYISKQSITRWRMLGSNDNSPELFQQPDGKKHNALLRLMTASKTQPLKLFPGLYRVKISASENGILKGSYLFQAGVNKTTAMEVHLPEEFKITNGK